MRSRAALRDRVVALVVAAGIATAPVPLPAARAASAAYTHVWQAQTMFSGETGASMQAVDRSEMSLTFADGGYSGTLRYSDRLAMTAPSGTSGQSSSIELTLTGTPLEGGSSAGGTFSGTATLVTAPAKDLKAALDRALSRDSRAVTVRYQVSGHWGARISAGVASGELLFERVAAETGVDADDARQAPWFNRMSLASPDGLGDGQEFSVRVQDAPIVSDGDDRPDGNAATATPRPVPETPRAGSGASFLDYVRLGLRGGAPRAAVAVPSDVARAARALRDARPSGATAMPSDAIAIDVDVAGAYLDAKNRAAGLLGDEGPLGDPAADAATRWAKARATEPGREGPPPGASAPAFYVERIKAALAEQGSVAGSAELGEEVSLIGPDDVEAVPALRRRATAVDAVGAKQALGGVLSDTARATRSVAASGVPKDGPLANAILASADDVAAPTSALVVSGFARTDSLDASASATGERLPNKVLLRHGVGRAGDPLGLPPAEPGGQTIQPSAWLAFRRADGATYWLAGESARHSLTDGSLRGWAFRTPRAWLVDSERCGRVRAWYPTG